MTTVIGVTQELCVVWGAGAADTSTLQVGLVHTHTLPGLHAGSVSPEWACVQPHVRISHIPGGTNCTRVLFL